MAMMLPLAGNPGGDLGGWLRQAPLSPAPVTPLTPNTGTWEDGAPPTNVASGGYWANNPLMQQLRAAGYTGPDPADPGEWNPYDISSSAAPTTGGIMRQPSMQPQGPITPTTPNTGTWGPNGAPPSMPGAGFEQYQNFPGLNMPGGNQPANSPFTTGTMTQPGGGGGGNTNTFGFPNWNSNSGARLPWGG